jgi:mycothiol S-conjugate amidase
VPVTTRVACGEYFPVRDQALLAHASQIDPNGFWFACPTDVQQAAWPTEDYHLAMSLVETEIPEDDLFAGIRPDSADGSAWRRAGMRRLRCHRLLWPPRDESRHK